MTVATQRLYLTADKSAVVGHNSPAAAFLLCAVGQEIPKDAPKIPKNLLTAVSDAGASADDDDGGVDLEALKAQETVALVEGNANAAQTDTATDSETSDGTDPETGDPAGETGGGPAAEAEPVKAPLVAAPKAKASKAQKK